MKDLEQINEFKALLLKSAREGNTILFKALSAPEVLKEIKLELEDIIEPESGDNVLHIAVMCGHLDIVQIAIERSLKIIYSTNQLTGSTALHCAVTYDQIEIVKYLAEKFPLLTSSQDKDGLIPVLHSAKHIDKDEITKYLIGQSTDLLIEDSKGENLYTLLKNRPDKNLLNLLQEKTQEKINQKFIDAIYKNEDIIEAIIWLGKGADINVKLREIENGNGATYTAFFHAVLTKNIAVMQGLIKYALNAKIKLNVNAIGAKNGFTPLHVAAEAGDIFTVELLMQAGAVMSEDNKGQTPLMLAKTRGHQDIVQLLEPEKPKPIVTSPPVKPALDVKNAPNYNSIIAPKPLKIESKKPVPEEKIEEINFVTFKEKIESLPNFIKSLDEKKNWINKFNAQCMKDSEKISLDEFNKYLQAAQECVESLVQVFVNEKMSAIENMLVEEINQLVNAAEDLSGVLHNMGLHVDDIFPSEEFGKEYMVFFNEKRRLQDVTKAIQKNFEKITNKKATLVFVPPKENIPVESSPSDNNAISIAIVKPPLKPGKVISLAEIKSKIALLATYIESIEAGVGRCIEEYNAECEKGEIGKEMLIDVEGFDKYKKVIKENIDKLLEAFNNNDVNLVAQNISVNYKLQNMLSIIENTSHDKDIELSKKILFKARGEADNLFAEIRNLREAARKLGSIFAKIKENQMKVIEAPIEDIDAKLAVSNGGYRANNLFSGIVSTNEKLILQRLKNKIDSLELTLNEVKKFGSAAINDFNSKNEKHIDIEEFNTYVARVQKFINNLSIDIKDDTPFSTKERRESTAVLISAIHANTNNYFNAIHACIPVSLLITDYANFFNKLREVKEIMNSIKKKFEIIEKKPIESTVAVELKESAFSMSNRN